MEDIKIRSFPIASIISGKESRRPIQRVVFCIYLWVGGKPENIYSRKHASIQNVKRQTAH
jgi:hypothetical protein